MKYLYKVFYSRSSGYSSGKIESIQGDPLGINVSTSPIFLKNFYLLFFLYKA